MMERTLVPNITPFPNFLSDEIMPLLSGDEWKIVHYAVVSTLRPDRPDDCITIAQFVKGKQGEDGSWQDHGTGLSEEQVKECLAFLCDKVQVFLRHDRPRKPMAYRLNPDIASAHWDLLEQRKKQWDDEAPSLPDLPSRPPFREVRRDGKSEAAAARRPVEPISEPPAPAKPRVAARGPGRQEARYTEKPQTTIRLADDSSPVLKQIRQKLSADERAAYEHLVRLYAHERPGIEDGEAWQIYCLWQTYGFSGLANALQGAGAAEAPDLAEVNHHCLLAEVLRTYEQEVGRVTPGLHKELEKLTAEFPVLEHWQEAFRVAVRINRRRLSTIETVLKNQREKEQGEAAAREAARPAANGSRPRRATKRRAPARPPAESPGKEAAKSGEEWTPPPE
jgi:hypothetical protein